MIVVWYRFRSTSLYVISKGLSAIITNDYFGFRFVCDSQLSYVVEYNCGGCFNGGISCECN